MVIIAKQGLPIVNHTSSPDASLKPGPAGSRTFPVLALILLIAALVSTGFLVLATKYNARRIDHFLAVREQASDALKLLLDAETGQRGFITTQDETYLDPYTNAVKIYPAVANRLRDVLAGDAEQLAVLNGIDSLVQIKLDELQATIDLTRQGRMGEVHDLVMSNVGKATMVRLRGLFDALQKTEAKHLIDRQRSNDLTESGLVGIILISVVGAAVLGLMHLHSSRRGLEDFGKQNRRLGRKVRAGAEELQNVAARLEAALKASSITVLTQDTDLRYTYLSQSLPGLVTQEAIGKHEADVLPPTLAPLLMEAQQKVLQTGHGGQLELPVENNGAASWLDVRIEPQLDEGGRIKSLISVVVDITSQKKNEDHIHLLMRELIHRSKNTLAVVQAMARQTAPNSVSIPDFMDRFSGRLAALAGSFDILVQDSWEGASLNELVRSQLSHYADLIGTQVSMAGPPIRLTPAAAQSLGMALYELGTNAAKYGALSTQAGKVEINWQIDEASEPPSLAIVWQESCGPPVSPPTRLGFGQIVIKRMTASALNAEVVLNFAPEGLRWSLKMPLNHTLHVS